ncbi:copper resistance protein CopC [Aeromicrobium sp. 636]|uniref:Copper resistance protein CopC n=1 Tax=Aeromicrobium senzhongii TaxID=2663859 RepID=A0A8I0ETF5_9ACTN|nr:MULTISPECIES: copper resistance CopC family protein [Aeromicrobium]MBC9225086.1 copper resistance protein CopC [Aeromicrobium senzhongii]MCQ3997196.1 copper resistance protein CopC [Aeromicrobium sp. 636]
MPAQAHTSLVSSDPAQGARLEQAPERIVLTFTESLRQPSEASLLVDGTALTAEIDVDGPRVVVTPPADAADGNYEVNYRVVSADGHPVTGTIEFAVGDADAVVDDEPTAGARSDAGDSDTDDGSVWTSPLLLGVLVAAVALGVAVLLLVRGRSRTSGHERS